jgi:hypothetical protein
MPATKQAPKHAPKEIAFYYPGPIWHGSDWIKTLILFFDGVGILLPNYMKGKLEREDPATAIPLMERDLLHILEPEKIVDKKATKQLGETMGELIKSGALDKLPKDLRYHEISYSRMGGYGDERIARDLLEKLKTKGLAKDTEDGVSVPMHPMVRALILVLLSQILRPHGAKIGAELSPATDRPEIVRSLKELLEIPQTPSAGHVVALDLEAVAVDLRLVPLDEVLDFRKQNFKAHRAYVRAVRKLTRELSWLSEDEREDALDTRRQEIQDLANDLKSTSRKAWKRRAGFAIGMAGAFWKFLGTDKAGAHDYVGLLLTAAGLLVGLKGAEKVDTGAYSYLFQASSRFPY